MKGVEVGARMEAAVTTTAVFRHSFLYEPSTAALRAVVEQLPPSLENHNTAVSCGTALYNFLSSRESGAQKPAKRMTPTPLVRPPGLAHTLMTLFPPGIEAIRAPGVLGGRDVDGVDADAESPEGRDDELGRKVRQRAAGRRNTREAEGGSRKGGGVMAVFSPQGESPPLDVMTVSI